MVLLKEFDFLQVALFYFIRGDYLCSCLLLQMKLKYEMFNSLPERCTRHRVFGTANLKAFINLIYGESLFVNKGKKNI